MNTILSSETMDIPEGVKIKVNAKIIEVEGPRGKLTRNFKHLNLDFQLIRYCVGKHDSLMRDLRQSDFDPKEKFWTRFPPEGSKCTTPHQSVDFKWKDYCPMLFREIDEEFAKEWEHTLLQSTMDKELNELNRRLEEKEFFFANLL